MRWRSSVYLGVCEERRRGWKEVVVLVIAVGMDIFVVVQNYLS